MQKSQDGGYDATRVAWPMLLLFDIGELLLGPIAA